MTSPEYNEYRELLKKGQYIEAVHLAERAYLKGNRNNSFWLTRQAAALSRAGKYDQGYGIAKQALALKPSNPYSILAVAEALSGLNRMDEALRHYEEIAPDPKLSLYARRGMLYCLSELKQWGRMLQLLGQWEMPPAASLQWKVKALTGQDRLQEAIEVCRQWLEREPVCL